MQVQQMQQTSPASTQANTSAATQQPPSETTPEVHNPIDPAQVSTAMLYQGNKSTTITDSSHTRQFSMPKPPCSNWLCRDITGCTKNKQKNGILTHKTQTIRTMFLAMASRKAHRFVCQVIVQESLVLYEASQR
jgi:hypothetical protein